MQKTIYVSNPKLFVEASKATGKSVSGTINEALALLLKKKGIEVPNGGNGKAKVAKVKAEKEDKAEKRPDFKAKVRPSDKAKAKVNPKKEDAKGNKAKAGNGKKAPKPEAKKGPRRPGQ